MFPKLYEVNTRVWIKQFGMQATLADVPISYLEDLANWGIDRIWLMGVWENCTKIVAEHALHPDLVNTYDQVLPGWRREDVIGSPYSIDRYEVKSELGGREGLKVFRERAKQAGLLLYLDFVPNHFGADSRFLLSHPEVFLQILTSELSHDKDAYFLHSPTQKKFLRGRDPYFPAWTDTVQINYGEPSARRFMIAQLEDISNQCDGVRCDMAMLVMNRIFKQTWFTTLNDEQLDYLNTTEEFWVSAVNIVKRRYPSFEFLAEAYWDMEWMLQQQGFDYTYDKRLLDRLAQGNAQTIKGHLQAEMKYQNKLSRFIENHDEDRAITKLGLKRSKAAAVIMSTIPGMKFYFDGQWQGKSVHIPVQLGRAPQELLLPNIQAFYQRLLSIISDKHFFHGVWTLLDVQSSGWDNPTYQSLLAWEWRGTVNHYVVVVNYSDEVSTGRIFTEWAGYDEQLILEDLLDGQRYERQLHQLNHEGLYIILSNFHCHIFKVLPRGKK